MLDFDFKIPFISKIISYIYDFCTYKKTWNLRVFFERRMTKDDKYYFSIRCVNNTSYNIQLTRIYIKEHKNKALLKIQHFKGHKDGVAITEYKDIERTKLTEECTNLFLSPKDTNEYRNYWTSDYNSGVLNNESTIKIEFSGNRTELFIEYEIKDIKTSLFLNFFGFANIRVVKVVIPV
jgi:hypothetical protein